MSCFICASEHCWLNALWDQNIVTLPQNVIGIWLRIDTLLLCESYKFDLHCVWHISDTYNGTEDLLIILLYTNPQLVLRRYPCIKAVSDMGMTIADSYTPQSQWYVTSLQVRIWCCKPASWGIHLSFSFRAEMCGRFRLVITCSAWRHLYSSRPSTCRVVLAGYHSIIHIVKAVVCCKVCWHWVAFLWLYCCQSKGTCNIFEVELW